MIDENDSAGIENTVAPPASVSIVNPGGVEATRSHGTTASVGQPEPTPPVDPPPDDPPGSDEEGD
ncbi:hypothetical protein ACFQE8_06880, partial [Salinirubellus sp. GCM10025818]